MMRDGRGRARPVCERGAMRKLAGARRVRIPSVSLGTSQCMPMSRNNLNTYILNSVSITSCLLCAPLDH